VQISTIDALLCIRYKLTLLTTDNDFIRLACPLQAWSRGSQRPNQASLHGDALQEVM